MTVTRMSLIGVLLFVGCATAPAPVARISFPADEYAHLNSTGVAVVKGQAFLKTRGGEVKTAAGSDVVLNPATSYSQQWYEVDYVGGKTLGDPDPRISSYILKTMADAEGRFTFRNVPSGDYYLVTKVVWDAPTRLGLTPQGGTIAKLITVKDGDELEIVLTK